MSAPGTIRAEVLEPVFHALGGGTGHVHIHFFFDASSGFGREALEAAARRMVERHPILACRYVTSGWRDRWVPTGSSPAVRTEAVEPGAVEEGTWRWTAVPLDLDREGPFRLVELEHREGSRVLLSILHLAMDGGALMSLFRELAEVLAGHEPSLPAGRRRSVTQLLRGVPPFLWPSLAREVLRELGVPRRLAAVSRRERPFPPGNPRGLPFWCTVTAELDQVKKRAQAGGGTVTDVLVAAIARASARRTTTGPAAILLTVDLRRFLRRPASVVANLSGTSHVFVPREDLATLDAAIARVASITRPQKRRPIGLASSLLPAFLMGWLPHDRLRRIGLEHLREQHHASFEKLLVLTNIGVWDPHLESLGSRVLAVSGVGPLMPGIPAPFVALGSHRNRLRIVVSTQGPLDPRGIVEYAGDLQADVGGEMTMPVPPERLSAPG